MTRFTISKVLFAFFALTTFAIFALAYSGSLVSMAGSLQSAFTIWAINTIGLIIVTLDYIWQKSKHNARNK